EEVVCPYCSTLYRHDATLSAEQTVPAGCNYRDPVVAAAE
ncbi:MAG: zinc-finger domain-containing protein, partial [Brucellaceae bacterium]|nr:zinc-finger domain-containing protein [Brucellaceae bacterium]